MSANILLTCCVKDSRSLDLNPWTANACENSGCLGDKADKINAARYLDFCSCSLIAQGIARIETANISDLYGINKRLRLKYPF